jgi:hypothetical protein
MNTNDLIENLAARLTPVEPLWRPGRRTLVWAVAAAVYIGVLAIGVAGGATANPGAGPAFWWPQLAALVAAVVAARAAFASVVPGARGAAVWAALAALVWLASLAAAASWQSGATILANQHEWACVAFIALGGLPLLAATGVTLRRGAPLRPATTGALAAFAVAALASVGACWSLPHPTNDVTLVWHGAAAVSFMLLGAVGAHFVLRWPRPMSPSARSSSGGAS